MVWSYCTSGGLWGAIFGHFGVVLGPIVSGWGLFGAYFSPLWLPKTTWIAPNLVQCERAWPWPYCTSGGHFGPFWSDFRAQSKRLGPVCSLFLTRLATQNDLNGPKSGTVGQGMTILYWWGPLGAILGHFGPFQIDFRAQSKRLGCLEPISHPFDYPKQLELLQI